ncbi:secretion protein SctD [Burkholderia sp. Ac-20384]|nr:secretion protein SctD [Burkholderia sp. Ac-20384]
MGTTFMKALRVLTGTHAGAHIPLASGVFRISGDDDADICISDWTVDEVKLVIDESGLSSIESSNLDKVLVADFVAVPFGDVVFCVGPDGADWPRDLDLLAGLWKTAEPAALPPIAADAQCEWDDTNAPAPPTGCREPSPEAEAKAEAGKPGFRSTLAILAASRKMDWRTTAAALICTAGVGTLGAMFAGAQSSEAANVKPDPIFLAGEVDGALHRAGFVDLHALPHKDGVAVEGIVPLNEDGTKAQQIMNALAPGKARRAYDVAQQVVTNIQQSLAGTGATVSYAGHGVFHVTGNVRAMTTFRTLIAGVRADLDRNIKRIDIDVKETKAPTADVEFTEVVATGGLRYIETPDGTKHLFESNSVDEDN